MSRCDPINNFSLLKTEAVSAIMLYTRSSEELLRRRKVRRENLYQYLAQQGYVEHPAADKNTLLKKVLKLWQLKKQGVGVDNKGLTFSNVTLLQWI